MLKTLLLVTRLISLVKVEKTWVYPDYQEEDGGETKSHFVFSALLLFVQDGGGCVGTDRFRQLTSAIRD